jgi:hypothetical protein
VKCVSGVKKTQSLQFRRLRRGRRAPEAVADPLLGGLSLSAASRREAVYQNGIVPAASHPGVAWFPSQKTAAGKRVGGVHLPQVARGIG